MKELIKAGLEVKGGKVRRSDVAKAIEILASEELTKDAFLDGTLTAMKLATMIP